MALQSERPEPDDVPFAIDFEIDDRGGDAHEQAGEEHATNGAPSPKAFDAPEEGSEMRDASRSPRAKKFARGDHVELGERLLECVERQGPPAVFDDGALYRYDFAAGLWLAVGIAEQSRIVQAFAGAMVEGAPPEQLRIKSSDVTGARTLAGHQRTQTAFFSDAPRGLAFANGFVSVTGNGPTLRAHAHENRARFGYTFPFVAGVAPLAWLKFLHALFRDDDDREEKVAFLQEFFGASLLGIAPTYQRCAMAIGEGGNGKSKFADVMLAAMPKGSTCAVAPQVFASEYRRALLSGKLLNVVNELPDADIIATEQFKAIVTGEPIDARPIREAPFTFRPQAGHYFAANRLPGTGDQSHGFWRRWVVVTFNRRFEGDPEHDPRIAEKVIATELPAIVSWLVEGGARVMHQGGYTIPSSHDAEFHKWRRGADQVALFVEDCTVPSKDERPYPDRIHDWTAAATLYAAFKAWSERNGHRPLASNKFGQRMAELGRPSRKTERGWFYSVRARRADEPLTDFASDPSRESRGQTREYN